MALPRAPHATAEEAPSVSREPTPQAHQYASHGITDYWVVDLQGDRVVVHREPTADGYASVNDFTRGQTVSPLAFPDVAFTVDEILA